MKSLLVHRWPTAIVILGMVVFAIYFSWLSIVKADVFDTYSNDLGNMWQSMWNVFHGHGFVFTWSDFATNFNRLGIHADYLLILLSPLTWLWPDPHSLLILQAVTVAAGAWFVWRLALHWLHQPWLALVLALGYLWYGPLQYAVVWQFHTDTLAVTLMLAAAEAFVARRRAWMFWAWFGAALLTKEHVGLVLGPMIWLLARQAGQGSRGWWPLATGCGYSLIHFFLVIPAFVSAELPYHGLAYFKSYASDQRGPVSALKNAWQHLMSGPVGSSALLLVLPLGGLALFSPFILMALMAMVPHWLADEPSKQTLIYHNQMLAIPALWLATILGARTMIQRWSAVTPRRLTIWLIGASLIGTVIISPNPWSFRWRPAYLIRNPYLAAIPAMKKILPPEASVSYSKQAGARFRDRLVAQVLPNGVTSVEYIVLVDGPAQLPDRQLQKDYDFFADYLATSAAFHAVYNDGHNFIYQRDFSVVPEPIPPEFISPGPPGTLRT